jgi:hypothetical protein
MFVPSAKTGKLMILDAKPRKGVILTRFATFDDPNHASATTASVEDVYTDHHATCPAVDEWKGKHR